MNGDMVCVQYFPQQGHAGHISNGSNEQMNDEEYAMFYVNTPTEELEICWYQVIGFAAALSVAREFSLDGKLPASIDWEELSNHVAEYSGARSTSGPGVGPAPGRERLKDGPKRCASNSEKQNGYKPKRVTV